MTVPSSNHAASSTTDVQLRRSRLFIDGAWIDGAAGTRAVLDKYTGNEIGIVDQASREQVAAAVAAARRSFERTVLDAQQRYTVLMNTAALRSG